MNKKLVFGKNSKIIEIDIDSRLFSICRKIDRNRGGLMVILNLVSVAWAILHSYNLPVLGELKSAKLSISESLAVSNIYEELGLIISGFYCSFWGGKNVEYV